MIRPPLSDIVEIQVFILIPNCVFFKLGVEFGRDFLHIIAVLTELWYPSNRFSGIAEKEINA